MISQPITFVKAAAAGNDFIIIDNRSNLYSGTESGFFQKICRRRFAVGADGVILIEAGREADFSIRYFNSDGRPAAMCGNGARAACYYLYREGKVSSRHKFEISGQLHEAYCSADDVRISMPRPMDFVNNPIILENSQFEECSYIHVGVPHLVVFCRDLDTLNIQEVGPKFRNNSQFPNGVNVDFVRIEGAQKLRVRTYERGVEGETMACGTGAVASAAVAHILHGSSSPIDIQTRGGSLQVSWEMEFFPIFLCGAVDLIYKGELLDLGSS